MIVLDKGLLLQADARLLVENETYAVFALRVEKQLLDRNLPFLAALADLVLAGRHRANA